jgi:peptidoglycan/LPS O-acetylase OafA/YrhL
MFPAIRHLTRRLTNRRLWIAGFVAAAVSVSIAAIGSLFTYTPAVSWAVVALPASRLPEFIIGVVLGTLMLRGWRPRVPIWIALLASVVAIATAFVAPYALSRYAVTLLPFALLIVALASSDLSMRRRTVFNWMPAIRIGFWSYCFYLVHNMVLTASGTVHAPRPVMIAIALVVSLLSAWLLHVLVEGPAERVLRPAGRTRLDTDSSFSSPGSQ